MLGVLAYLLSEFNCSDEEKETFVEGARKLRARINEATCMLEINKIEQEIRDLAARASIARCSLNELDLAKDLLPNRRAVIAATSMVRQNLDRGKKISIDLLQSRAGLPPEQFAILLIDLCKRFDVSISGNEVAVHDDADLDSFMQEVDGFFARWRGNEARKLGKVVSPEGH